MPAVIATADAALRRVFTPRPSGMPSLPLQRPPLDGVRRGTGLSACAAGPAVSC